MIMSLPILPNLAQIGLPINPEGPNTVALIPELAFVLWVMGSYTNSFFYIAKVYF